jgi:tetratricopeptide (TPR) repeat protein
MELQPVSYDNQQTYAIALYYARRYAESEAEWRRLIDLNPNHPLIYDFLIKCLAPQGKESEALENLIKRLSITKAGDENIERVRRAYATSGWRGVNLERIRIAEASEEPNINELARLYAAVGDKEKAIAYLEKAVRERSNMIAVLQVDPDLDPLRGDPRFEDLVKRIEGQK